jgi:putative two-component system hydrogenase maturation factor HypX/HoxX
MRILFLVHAFNGLSQRLHVELCSDGHEVSVELDIHDQVSIDAVALFAPDIVLAPYLKRAIPAAIWQNRLCWVVHPGPPGDRGPAALDWAILRGVPRWGVTVLQAQAEMDAGPVWGTTGFAMRAARKSSLYRQEVTEAAVRAVRQALVRFNGGLGPVPRNALAAAGGDHGWQPAISQAQRAIAWDDDDSAAVLRKLHAADGFPGVEHELLGRRFRMFDAHLAGAAPGLRASPASWSPVAEAVPAQEAASHRPAAPHPHAPQPGSVIGRGSARGDPGAICLATRDGALWIGQLQEVHGDGSPGFKQSALSALGARAQDLPVLPAWSGTVSDQRAEIRYEESGTVGFLYFDFYNGALSTAQCQRLRAAYQRARARPTRVIALMGGADFWCNGMHLHAIEAAPSAGTASWENILEIDALALDILTTDSHLTIAALCGNAAAGGVFLALATDHVLARTGVVLNPHYRNMGNLYGSEYWTYVLPRRTGAQGAQEIVARRLPMGAPEALGLRLVDEVAGPDQDTFRARLELRARTLAEPAVFGPTLAAKRARRTHDESVRPLAAYRDAELEQLRLNFFGFDPSYHVARHRFVHRSPAAWTPVHLARHRQLGFAPGPAVRAS